MFRSDYEDRRSCASVHQFILNPIIKGIRYIWGNKSVTAISTLSTVATALYALTFYSGVQPQNISNEWWNSMTTAIQLFSVMNACVAAIVNMLINAKYLPLAGVKLKNNLSHACESSSALLENMICLLGGIMVGIIYGAQSYNAFLWANIVFSIISGLSNFLSYSARRYNSLVDLTGKLKDIFNSDRKFQQECLTQLKHLKPEHVHEFAKFNEMPLNEDTVYSFLTALFDKANNNESVASLFYEKTRADCLKETGLTFMKFAIGLFCAPAAFCVGIQNGNDGMKILTNNYSDNLSNIAKFSLVFTPSLVNAIFYYISGFGCIDSVIDMYDRIQDNKKHIFTAFFAFFLNALCATAYFDIAKGTEGTNNILGIQSDTPFGDVLNYLFLLSAFITGINNTDSLFQDKNPSVKNVRSISRWLEHNKLSEEHITALRQLEFFRPKSTVLPDESKPEKDLTKRLLSTYSIAK